MEEAAEMSESPTSPEMELNEEEIFNDSSSLSLSEEKQKKVLIKYIQEKRDLQEQLEAKHKDLLEYKAKVYDLKNKITALQQENSNLKKNAARAPPLANRFSNVGSRSPALSRTGVVRPSTTKKVQRGKGGTKKKSTVNSKTIDKLEKEESVSGTPEPIDQKELERAATTLKRYKEYSQRFPELKLSVILQAEAVFCEADVNHDGTIDEEELENLLEKQGHYMTTKKEVRQIMQEIDKDETGTIDLMEYMAVMERVQQRKRTNLPPQLTKSTVCTIQ